MNTSKLRHSLLLASLLVPFFSTAGCASEDKAKDKPGDVPAGDVDVGFVSAEICAGPQRGSGFAWDCETGTTIAVSRGSCDELHEFCFNLQSRHTNYVCVWNDAIIAGARDGAGVACPSVGASFDDSGYGGAGGASGGSAGAGGGTAGGGTAGGGGDAGSCEGYCGAQSPEGCFCDDLCERIGDCCSDKPIFCGAGGSAGGGTGGAGGGTAGAGGASGGSAGAGGGTAGVGGASGGSAGAGGGTAGGGGGDFFGSCEGFCGGVSPDGCFCDEICEQAGDCCADKVELCGGGGAGGEGGFGGGGGGYSGAGGTAGAGGGTAGAGGFGAGGGGGFGGGTAGGGGFGGGTAGGGGFGGGTAGAGGFGGGTAGAGGGNGGNGGGTAGAGGGNVQGLTLGALLQKLLLSAERAK